MNLIFCDESVEGGDLAVMGALILEANFYPNVERYMAAIKEALVPCPEGFEFHASALLQGKDRFQGIGRDRALEILKMAATFVQPKSCHFVYGAVNIRALRNSVFATAEPRDIAFRGCLDGLQKWFSAQAEQTVDRGLLICDDTTNNRLKEQLRTSYRLYRGRIVGGLFADDEFASCIHDDMYFGDSKYSIGLQLADICSYIVLRHWQGKEDTEFLYEMIRGAIFAAAFSPDGAFPLASGEATESPKPA